jgi:hypothetical protein
MALGLLGMARDVIGWQLHCFHAGNAQISFRCTVAFCHNLLRLGRVAAVLSGCFRFLLRLVLKQLLPAVGCYGKYVVLKVLWWKAVDRVSNLFMYV